MSRSILSVVIPCYQAEEYLPECLDSVCSQDLDDIEIICVDDGSSDGTAGIISEWQDKDARIRVIRQDNQGVSVARNTGLQAARGTLVYFLDSDDRVSSKDILRRCCERMTADDLDVLAAPGNVFYDPPELEERLLRNERSLFAISGAYPGIYKGADLIEAMRLNSDWCAAVTTKMFRRTYLNRNSLRFIPGQMHEDEFFSFCSVFLAARAAVISEPLVDRRVHQNSLMTTPVSYSNILGDTINMVEILRFMEKHRDIHEIDPVIGTSVIHSHKRGTSSLQRLSNEVRAEFLDKLTPDLMLYYKAFVEDEVYFRRRSHSLDLKLNAETAKSSELEEKLKAEAEKSSSLKEQLRSETEKSSALEKKLQSETEKSASLESRLRTETENCVRLEAELQSQTEISAGLEKHLDSEKKKNTELESTVRSQTETIACLNRDLTSETERADDLENRLQDETAVNASLEESNQQLRTHLAWVKNKIAELQQSHSYRLGRFLTWPVRFLRRLLRPAPKA